MSLVVVERAFEDDDGAESFLRTAQALGDGCFEAHGVRFVRTLFSREARRMVCFYEGPDAESVRRTQDVNGLPFVRAWTARTIVHAPDDDGAPGFVVAQHVFERPVTERELVAAFGTDAAGSAAPGCRTLWSFLSPDGLRGVSVHAAPDVASVRDVQRRANLPFAEAWTAIRHESGPSIR